MSIKGFLVFWVLLIPETVYSKADTRASERVSVSNKPLVLQWEVSHARNKDQISLIFKGTTAELVTNTDSYQRDKPVRLGRFKINMNLEFRVLRKRIRQYYLRLKSTVPMSSLIRDPRFQSRVDPHAPILCINEENIQEEHPYFESLVRIIRQIGENKWVCVACAIYTKEGNFIVRTVTETSFSRTRVGRNRQSRKKRFSREELSCFPKGKNKVECVDPEFGIFSL